MSRAKEIIEQMGTVEVDVSEGLESVDEAISCPVCQSTNLEDMSGDRYRCNDCSIKFSLDMSKDGV